MSKQFFNITEVPKGHFNSSTGEAISLLEPSLDSICIEDIACGLSNICRFGGQVRDFYSVAQHSILVCELAPHDLKLEALMHDASEAYLGDIIKPLKVLIESAYGPYEERFMDMISVKFNLDAAKLEAIKPYDMQALEIEQSRLQLGNTAEWLTLHHQMGLSGQLYNPRVAEMTFMKWFRKYFKGY